MSIKERIAAMNLTKEKRLSGAGGSPGVAGEKKTPMKKRFTLNHVDPAGARVPAPICPGERVGSPTTQTTVGGGVAAESPKPKFTLVRRTSNELMGGI